jgi:hypothetical protein
LAALIAALALVLSLLPGRAQAGPIHASVLFAPPIVVETSQLYMDSMVVADFDGDGRPDIAMVSENLVAWYRNNGDGTFGGQQTISTALLTPTCLFAADLDNDGRIDVAVSALLDDSEVSWFRNEGGGVFGSLRTVSTIADGATSVSAADLDGDGLRDLLSTSAYDRKVAWYRNLGGGNFGAPATNQNVISTVAFSPAAIAVADLDGDGVRDLVVTAQTGILAWFKGSISGGSPQFTRYVIATNQSNAVSSAVADFDGDGWPDVVCGASNANTITWFRNLTHDSGAVAPFFGAGQLISGIAQGVYSVIAPDLDYDGRPDVVAALHLGNKVTRYQNLGGGNFGWNAGNPSGNELAISTDAPGAVAVAVADFNLDGKIDVAAATQIDGKFSIFLNEGGQCAMASFNSAPATMIAGSRDDVLRIAVSNRGLPGDNDAKPSALTFLFEKSAGVAMSTTEANALIDHLQLFVDSNNSGSLEFASDTLVGTVDDLQLTGGRLTFAPQPANASDIAVAPGTTRSFFLVTRTASNGAAQNPNTFLATHVSQGAGRSVIVDAVSGAALTVETAINPDAPSSLVTVQQPHTYTDWSIIHFDVTGAPGTGPSESKFADGIVNLLKYAFADDPLTDNGALSLPQMQSAGAAKVFRHYKLSWSTDLAYQYEISRDMLSWAPAISGVDYQKTDTQLPNGVVQSDLVILGNWLRSFMRVRVQLN